MITVSAPGKVILMGDHAVVYGKPALVAAIDRRLRVAIQVETSLEACTPTIHIESSEDGAYVRHAIETACKMAHIEKLAKVHVTVSSDLTPGYHIGTSAAVAVATVGAVLFAGKKLWNPSQINQIAYEVEKLQHGTPSGVDNTSVTMGGLLWYRKELEFLKSMWQLPLHVSSELDHFYLVDTGRPQESTGEMIAYLRERYEQQPSPLREVFDENECQTKNMAIAIKESDSKGIIEALRLGNHTLEAMGVVSPDAREIIKEIELSGGAAKILGGGGKRAGVGYLLAYHESYELLRSRLAEREKIPEKIMIGQDGVRLDLKE